MILPSTTISAARLQLAEELGLEPGELEYGGVQKGLGYRLVLFTIRRPGHFLDKSTRSARVDL